MHRRRRLTRRDAIWAGLCALLLLGGGVAYAATTPGSYNCTRTDRDGGFALDCTEAAPAPSDSPTPSPSATQSPSPSPSPTVQPSHTVTPTTTTAPPTTPPATTPPPSPSPTVTGPFALNCWNRLAQCGYPTPETTGWATQPTVVFNGNMVIRAAGVYENLDVKGCVDVRATGVTIRNSRITCQGDALITYNSPAHNDTIGNTVIERVEVSCVVGKGSGIYGHNFTAIAVWVHDCENGAEINAWSSITDSVLSAREATSLGHGDGIQSQGGDHVTIRHNTLLEVNPVTSAIITNPDQNQYWTVEDNFMGGGAYTFYLPENGRTGWVVRNNRFIRPKTSNPYSAAYGLLDACGSPIQWTNNKLDDDGTLVPC